jgi:hypothetical protein
MIQMIASLVLVLYAGIAWVILKKYRQTHNFGFLVLGCGLLLWPFAGGLLRMEMLTTMRQIGHTQSVDFFPFTLIASGQVTPGWMIVVSTYVYQAIDAGLILIGLLVIGRSINVIHPRIAGIDDAMRQV